MAPHSNAPVTSITHRKTHHSSMPRECILAAACTSRYGDCPPAKTLCAYHVYIIPGTKTSCPRTPNILTRFEAEPLAPSTITQILMLKMNRETNLFGNPKRRSQPQQLTIYPSLPPSALFKSNHTPLLSQCMLNRCCSFNERSDLLCVPTSSSKYRVQNLKFDFYLKNESNFYYMFCIEPSTVIT